MSDPSRKSNQESRGLSQKIFQAKSRYFFVKNHVNNRVTRIQMFLDLKPVQHFNRNFFKMLEKVLQIPIRYTSLHGIKIVFLYYVNGYH